MSEGEKRGQGLRHFTFFFFCIFLVSIYQFNWHKLSQWFRPSNSLEAKMHFNFFFCVLNFWLIPFSSCRALQNQSFHFSFLFTFSFAWRLLDKHMDCLEMVWPFSHYLCGYKFWFLKCLTPSCHQWGLSFNILTARSQSYFYVMQPKWK